VTSGLKSHLHRFRARLTPQSERSARERFLIAGHNRLLMDNLPLTPKSVVLDVGGYRGDYSAAVVTRYGCRVHIFEPVPEYVEVLRQRFDPRSPVRIHPYGLGATDRMAEFDLEGDSTGVAAMSGRRITVPLRAVDAVFAELPVTVDLMAINIEGGEYELIPAMAGLLPGVQRLFIQFHDVGAQTVAALDHCRRILGATHTQDWSYDMVWESWSRMRG
jgi:FkbM family methyltransferase